MKIYTEINDVLDHMFNACTTSQISEFIPEKRGFRLHGHSTTICLERAFWNVLDDMARESKLSLPPATFVVVAGPPRRAKLSR